MFEKFIKSWRKSDKAEAEEAQVEAAELPRRETAMEVLERTELPDREVSLDSISIHKLGFNWDALFELGIAARRLQEEVALSRFNIAAQLKSAMPPNLHDGIPLVGSAIANHYNSDIPVLRPSEEEIKKLKPMLDAIANILGSINPKWKGRFNSYIETRAENIIEGTAAVVCRVIDSLSEVERPRDQFVPEMTKLYKSVAEPVYQERQDFWDSLFGDEGDLQEVPIEDRVRSLILDMFDAKSRRRGRAIGRKQFPLTNWMLQTAKFPPSTMNIDTAALVGSEITQGIEVFLRQQGMNDIPQAPQPSLAFDLFDIDTWANGDIMRALAEIFAPEKIEAVKRELPNILTQIKSMLPKSGPAVANAVQKLSEDILILTQQGTTGREIAEAIRVRPGK